MKEELLPSSRVLKYGVGTPCTSNAAYVATSATISGDVSLGNNTSIGYGAVLRADLAGIKIGDQSHIKDNVVIHVDYSLPTVIGNNTVIDNGAIIHACTIDDNCLIGEGVTVLDGAHICEGAAIVPGSVVTPRKTVGMGEVWAGIPARKVRDLTAAEKAEIQQLCVSLSETAQKHATETNKSYEDLLVDAADAEDKRIRDITYAYNPNPNTVHPERRGLIYDRLPPEFDDEDDTPAVVPRPDARELQDLTYDVVSVDEEEFAKLPHLPDHELKH